jgi:hypothetical protein
MSSQQLFAFVLMPFDKKLLKRYTRIQKIVRKAGIRAERVDDQSFHRVGIVERIHNQIETADFIIADMSKRNPNVFYEVGYAISRHKLCILLTNDPNTIPFDLKDRNHIVFYSPKDLDKKLLRALEAVKSETDLLFDRGDHECFNDKVQEYERSLQQIPTSLATSIRIRVRANMELQPKNVTAYITKIEKSSHRGWQEHKLPENIPLTWAETDNIVADFGTSNVKYVNVLHITHSNNKIILWNVPPGLFTGFFDDLTTYRITIAALARQYTIEVDWEGKWQTIEVRPAV